MMKKSLWTGLLAGVMLCFLFQSTATASRIQLELGWHNLDDFYLVDANEGPSDLLDSSDILYDDTIKTGLLKRSVLGNPGGIHLKDLGFDENDPDVDVWKLTTYKKFDKWIDKKSKKALKSAAKQYQKSINDGKKSGWKTIYKTGYWVEDVWMEAWKDVEDVWTLYHGDDANSYVIAAFDKKFNGKKFNGRIGDQKFKAYLEIFANPFEAEIVKLPVNPVPEPATMVLFGLGLLGLAGVSRKKLK